MNSAKKSQKPTESPIAQSLDKIMETMPDEVADLQLVPEQESPCRSSESEKLREKLLKGHFPLRHVDALDSMWGESLEKADQLWERVQQKDCLLILCGDRGKGKTQVATYWAAKLAKPVSGHCGLYFKAHDLLETIREKYSSDHNTSKAASALLKRLEKTAYLVIDEHSELAGTEWEQRTLTTIIDKRYDGLKRTIINTNSNPAKVAEEVGRSVFSRAQEVGGIVSFDWASYRGRKQ